MTDHAAEQRAPRLTALLSAVPVLLAALVHYSILDNTFASDDFSDLYRIANAGFWDYVSNSFAGHLYTARNLFFFALIWLFGLHALPFFVVFLGMHLLNTWILFQVIRVFTGRALLACFGAALWGMSPLAQGSIGWCSALGHVLLATALLWILWDLARIVRAGATPTVFTVIRWYVLMLVISTSYGVGLGIAMTFSLVLFLVLPGRPFRRRVGLVFLSLVAVLPALYLFEYGSAWMGSSDDGLPLLGKLLGAVPMTLHCCAYSLGSLVTGPFLVCSRTGVVGGPLEGTSSATVIVICYGLSALFAVGIFWRYLRGGGVRLREIAAMILIAASAYGAISFGRTVYLEAHGMSLARGVSMTRYHYVGQLAFCLAVVMLLDTPRPLLTGRKAGAALIGWFALTLVTTVQVGRSDTAFIPAGDYGEFERAQAKISQLIMNQPEGANVFIRNRPLEKVRMGPKARSRFPGWAAVFLITYPENVVEGRTVYFVERNLDTLKLVRGRGGARIDELLVSPKQQRAIAAGRDSG